MIWIGGHNFENKNLVNFGVQNFWTNLTSTCKKGIILRIHDCFCDHYISILLYSIYCIIIGLQCVCAGLLTYVISIKLKYSYNGFDSNFIFLHEALVEFILSVYKLWSFHGFSEALILIRVFLERTLVIILHTNITTF